ncbi:hypothetical protein EMIHUDRAFT_225232 [Emiliania huxleyi CCMP1516]|uniref:PDZ domain-containing protein n=2 Tax=Emiliania huxleyi TaxID=2903 RepID=A0A0D3KPH1_EMIH1|nr:hypothetical protein EMIHUDRAFT_225232 [Emiliania huxleyi CCMP1516]EOD37656.1 hypothetical protein EMIHUDRAFT_225232 [Emiliania huxleyi CCMP1516]|eukprot:XP_005790085.1 hypothetical protein EMIHUDRAFT_225232 [Emiliania huxleyi CCMP1516]
MKQSAFPLALLFAARVHSLSPTLRLPSRAALKVGSQVAAGQYGRIHLAEWDGVPAVAKRPYAALAADAALAGEYFNVEREVNEAIQRSSPETEHFPRFLGCASSGGDEWLVWERLAGCCLGGEGEAASELARYSGSGAKLEADHGLSPRCTLLDRARSRCTSLDPDRSPCSPLYAPPEQFASPDFPFAFDVYCLGISYLRLSLSCLKSDSQLEAFRIELSSLAGGASPAAAAPEPLSDALPADSLPLLAAMLREDPARRPTIDSLLEHPFLRAGAGSDAAGLAPRPAWLSRLLGGGGEDECERPLAVRVRLRPPLGLLLGEASSDGERASLAVEELLDEGAAAASGRVRAGDRLVSIDGETVRDASLDEVMGMLRRSPRRAGFELGFERSCSQEQCDISTELDPDGAGGGGSGEGESVVAPPRAGVGVIDAGSADWLGKRATQEDTHAARAARRREPSPLAAAWRAVAQSYGEGGEQDGACASMALVRQDGLCEAGLWSTD